MINSNYEINKSLILTWQFSRENKCKLFSFDFVIWVIYSRDFLSRYQVKSVNLINLADWNAYFCLSKVENLFDDSPARYLVCRPAFCPSRLISSCFRRSTTTPRETAKRHWEERENKDGRKAPCVVAFSTGEYGGCAMLGGVLGECGRRTESKRRRPGWEKGRDTLSQRTSSHPPDSADQVKKYDKRCWQNWRIPYREFSAESII